MKVYNIKNKFGIFKDSHDMLLSIGFVPKLKLDEKFGNNDGFNILYDSIDYNTSLFKFLGEENGTYFYQKYNKQCVYYTTENLNLNKNDVIIIHEQYQSYNNYLNQFVITSGSFKKIYDYDYDISITWDEIINIQDTYFKVEHLINMAKQEEENQRIEDEKEEKRKEEQLEKEQHEKDNWKTDGIYDLEGIKINKNVMKNGGDTITMSDNFNKYFECYEIGYLCNSNIEMLKRLVNVLDDNKSLDIKIEYGKQNKLPFDIHIETRKSTFNGVKVGKNMITTIFRNSRYKNTVEKPLKKEYIEGLNNLGVTKRRVLEQTEFYVYPSKGKITIPVEFVPIDKRGTEFLVTINGEEFWCRWALIKNVFRISNTGGRWTLDSSDYFYFMKQLGIKQEDALKHFQEAKMLGGI